MHAAHLADAAERAAPLMGEHSVEVINDWLGLPEAKLRQLLAEHIVTEYMAFKAA